jgi:hypothetical protein
MQAVKAEKLKPAIVVVRMRVLVSLMLLVFAIEDKQ